MSVIVQFEKDSYRGIASAMPASALALPALAAAALPYGLGG
jgi:hypothetical protein